MFEVRYIAAQVAFHRPFAPHVIYRVGPVFLHPAFAAANFVPGVGPVIVKAGSSLCSLDGLDD